MWDDEIDSTLLASLQVAYLRRKRWEARLQASEVVRALGQGLTEGTSSTASARYEHVSPEALMAKMGAQWH